MTPYARRLRRAHPRPNDPRAVAPPLKAADAFWAYAVALYARQDVAQACLYLQDHHGLNVNVLLFCVWTGDSGYGPLAIDALTPIITPCLAWHDAVVAPLRRLRRSLRDDAPAPGVPDHDRRALHRRLLRDELAAERIAQGLLCAPLTQPPRRRAEPADRCQASINTLTQYLRWRAAPLNATGQQAVHTLLSAAYPTLPDADMRRKLRRTGLD